MQLPCSAANDLAAVAEERLALVVDADLHARRGGRSGHTHPGRGHAEPGGGRQGRRQDASG